MSERQALRDLQLRLSGERAAAPAEPASAAWLAVECAGRGLLFPLAGAGEIFAVGTVVAVPHTQPWFVGVANLRGTLYGVVDLAAFLGLRAARSAADAGREHARLLALGAVPGTHCALLVDRLAGLRGAASMAAEPDDGVARPAFAGPLWRDAAGRPWQEIDLAALAAHEQFLAIAA